MCGRRERIYASETHIARFSQRFTNVAPNSSVLFPFHSSLSLRREMWRALGKHSTAGGAPMVRVFKRSLFGKSEIGADDKVQPGVKFLLVGAKGSGF